MNYLAGNSPLGKNLELLCKEARQEVVLVAPFMKVNVVDDLLSVIPPNISLKLVTRWRPEEIASGVSDLEVWEALSRRPNSSLWLRADLHAKYYRADGDCLVGSANLTKTALGWVSNPNLELLVALPVSQPELQQFEAQLFEFSIQVDQNIYEQLVELVQAMKAVKPEAKTPELELEQLADETTHTASFLEWLPTLRFPELLYQAYCGESNSISEASKEAALYDLAILNLPQGLFREAFDNCVGFQLLQTPTVQQIDRFVGNPQRFGAVTALLQKLPCSRTPDFNADRTWQTTMRWLLYFLPQRYQITVPNYSEIFQRKTI